MHCCRTVAGGKYGLDVDAMLRDIEPWQFEEWIALYQLEPWGADWQQTGLLAAKLSSGDCSPADFIPSIDNQRTAEVSDEALAASWRARLAM